jgi:hypothetical protein
VLFVVWRLSGVVSAPTHHHTRACCCTTAAQRRMAMGTIAAASQDTMYKVCGRNGAFLFIVWLFGCLVVGLVCMM